MNFSESATQLFDLGYEVIPVKGKRPTVDNWQQLQITTELVTYWKSNGQALHNVGLRCGTGALAVYGADFDFYDLKVSRAVRESFGQHFGVGPVRVGMAPKSLMVYQGEAGQRKMTSKLWTSPDGKRHRFELLGAGQQFVVSGIHPDTGKSYRWPNGGIDTMEPWELPTLAFEAVQTWIDDVLPTLIPSDWSVVADGGDGLPRSDDPLDNLTPRLDVDEAMIDQVLSVLDPDMDHDAWVKVGMGLHHQLGDDGLVKWRDWSARGEKFNGREIDLKWRSFKDDGDRRCVTFATALKMAKESSGWAGVEKARKVATLQKWIGLVDAADDAHELQRMAEDDIAEDKTITDMDRLQIIAAIQTKAQAITGVRPTKDIVAKWVAPSIVRGILALPDISTDGYPLPTAANVKAICDNLGVTIRYNITRKDDEILIPGATWSDDNRREAALAWLIDACHRAEVKTGNIGPFVTMLADQNQFNPVMSWITSKPWDGVSRMAEFYATVTERKGEIATGLKDVLMLRWLVSAVRAAAHPEGIAAQGVLVFQGDQYAGKTRWIKSLAPTLYKFVHEGLTLDPKNKDSVKIAISHWIVELGELDSTFKKADISALKAFITQPFDIFRRPYARSESEFSRRTVFGASVNDDQFLQDPTGNRRFWTIPVESIRHDHGIDMQQLWAEVYQEHYQKGEKHYLTPTEMAALNDHNMQFTVGSPIGELISSRLDWENFDINNCRWMTCSDILRWLDVKNPTRFESTDAGRQITKLTRGLLKKRSHGNVLRPVPLRRRAVSGEFLDDGVTENDFGVIEKKPVTPEDCPF